MDKPDISDLPQAIRQRIRNKARKLANQELIDRHTEEWQYYYYSTIGAIARAWRAQDESQLELGFDDE